MRASDLDDHLGAAARLAVVATLYPGAPLSFRALKGETGLADGNLHVQTRRLAEAGYLTITKVPQGRRTQTTFRITEEGGLKFRLYAQRLASVVAGDQTAIIPQPARERYDRSRVW
jgi:DNA-binding MarR family transcriptional regulator